MKIISLLIFLAACGTPVEHPDTVEVVFDADGNKLGLLLSRSPTSDHLEVYDPERDVTFEVSQYRGYVDYYAIIAGYEATDCGGELYHLVWGNCDGLTESRVGVMFPTQAWLYETRIIGRFIPIPDLSVTSIYHFEWPDNERSCSDELYWADNDVCLGTYEEVDFPLEFTAPLRIEFVEVD